MTSIAEYNNNPGNLKPPPKVRYQGQIGVDEQGFAIFENKEAGRNALINDILVKQKRGLNTPESFIDRYAPAGDENPDESRENYKIKLAQHLGLKSTTDPFPKGSEQKIADLIASFESGQPIVGQPKQKNDQQGYEGIFGVGEKTELQRMTEEGSSGGSDERPWYEKAIDSPADAAIAGAALLGVPAGIAARSVTLPYVPSESRLFTARERLAAATENLEVARTNAAKFKGVPDLEDELKKAQGAYASAEAELTKATDELKAARASRTAPVAAAPEPGLTPTPDQQARGIQGTTKDTGITGRASQTTYNERTAQIARNERAQRAALQALQRQGIIDPAKAYQLTEGISGSTPSGVLVPPGEAAISQAKLEAELAPLVEKEIQAKEARRQAGEARKAAGQSLRESQKAQKAVETAQTGKSGVNAAQSSLSRLEKQVPGPIRKAGLATTGKVASKVAGLVSGAGTGMSIYDAIEKIKAGDYSGAVLPTIEAGFGLLSMIPPVHPVAVALRGIGNIGGATLGAYELGKAGKERFIDQE